MGLTIDKMINRTSRKWFLEEGFSMWDVGKDHNGEEYIDLNLTDYKVSRVYKKEVKNKLSKLRYIVIENCLIKPGFGEGKTIINDREFKITYAWAGLSSARNYHRQLGYLVRIKPTHKFNLEKFASNFMKILYYDENFKIKKRIKKIVTYTFEESTLLKRKYMRR